MAEMTKEVLVAACKANGGYAAPRLNDQLFLQFRGFARIGNLEDYINLKVLWLEQNAISDFTGIEALQQLVSLFVQNNTITSLRTLSLLSNLRVFNISHNYLNSLSGIASACPLLETLQVSHNHIGSLDDCSDLWDLGETLTSLDLSFNKIDVCEGGLGPLEFFKRLPRVSVIYFHGNPASRGMKGYRRSMILQLPQLTYLDERPVFQEERRVVEAWGAGGEAAEMQAREAIRKEKKEHLESCVKILSDRMEENREVRDRLSKQLEMKRAKELEQFRESRRKWCVQQEELESTEERSRMLLAASEGEARLGLSEAFQSAKEALDATEAVRLKALEHERAVEAVRAAALKEIEEEEAAAAAEEEGNEGEDVVGSESATHGWLLSDEEVLQKMEEEIMHVLGSVSSDPHVGRTALKMERAMMTTASRLSAEKKHVEESQRNLMWKKFAAWENRARE